MRKIVFMALCLMLATGASQLRAQNPEDAEGCKDSPLITRLPGSKINSCDHKEFDQADFPSGEDKTKHLEGEIYSWDMGMREGTSELQIFRNFDTALRKAGYQIVYEASPENITASKGNTWILIESKGTYYYQTIVTVQEMKQEVTADAAAMSDELNKSGHVAVYGILFDTGKATLQPASDTTLQEIVKLLTENPDLKLRVEGHTDNVGAATANQALSEKRAQTVRDWLVGHGVTAGRLTAKGFGASQPVADNGTDEGRAKNRRVELAKL